MELLQSGVGCTVIALWLGHESAETTHVYLHADMQIKKQAMDRTRPVEVPKGVYRPDDELLAFLNSLPDYVPCAVERHRPSAGANPARQTVAPAGSNRSG